MSTRVKLPRHPKTVNPDPPRGVNPDMTVAANVLDMTSFGNLKLLLDARLQVSRSQKTSKLLTIQDFSPGGLNSLVVTSGVGTTINNASIGGDWAFGVTDGVSTSSPHRGSDTVPLTLTPTVTFPITVVTVALLHNPASSNAIVDDSLHNCKLVGRATGQIQLIGQAGAKAITSANGFISTDRPFICVAVWNGTNSFARINGVQAISGDTGTASGDLSDICIGSAFIDVGLSMNGQIQVLAVYQGAMDATVSSRIEKYLDRTSNLGLGL